MTGMILAVQNSNSGRNKLRRQAMHGFIIDVKDFRYKARVSFSPTFHYFREVDAKVICYIICFFEVFNLKYSVDVDMQQLGSRVLLIYIYIYFEKYFFFKS